MDGVMYDLGTLSGGDSQGFAINNLGEVVGRSGNRAVYWQVVLRAAVDIVPGSASNALKLGGGGTVSVAVLGSRYFDAGAIDARTVTLGNEDGSDTPVARKKNGAPLADLRDVNRDGYADLVVEFDRKQMVSNGDLNLAASQLILLASRIDGRRVRGVDQVTVH
jgi:hypothetical protein